MEVFRQVNLTFAECWWHQSTTNLYGEILIPGRTYRNHISGCDLYE